MIQLIILLLALVTVLFPIWAFIRILALGRENNALAERLEEIDRELRALRISPPPPATAVTAVTTTATPAPLLPAAPPALVIPPPPSAPAAPVWVEPPPVAPPLSEPPPLVVLPPTRPPETHLPPPRGPRVDWEQFMGAKLFAWLGGLAAFLGAVFFVKYSFEHDLIPPELRVAIGYVFAVALVAGGFVIPRARYAITGQTLCATGIVSLYGVTFAGNAIYHFPFFGPMVTFVLMSLVTAAAFFLAVRLEARVVAVLGMVGGFLTPVLLSTGQDNPVGLFTYIALLDVGLIAVALHRRWHFLVALGAGGTVLMQVSWAFRFLNAQKATTAMVVCLGFCALWVAAHFAAQRLQRLSSHLRWSTVVFPLVAFGFALTFLDYRTIYTRPVLFFAFVLAADLCLLALAWWDEALPRIHLIAGLAVFALIATWTAQRLTPDLLPWALGITLVYAVLHTAFPLVLEQRRPAAAPTWWSQLFPPLALLLMAGPLFKLEHLTLAFWPCILLVDLLAIGLALFTASLTGVGIVLLLTLALTAAWILRVPATAGEVPELLFVIGGFAVVFFAAGLFLARRLGDRFEAGENKGAGLLGDPRVQLPAFAALLPFLLLMLVSQRLPLANPSPVFGLAGLLIALTFGLTVILIRSSEQLSTFDSGPPRPAGREGRSGGVEWLPACALMGVAALQYAWREAHFSIAHASVALAWFLGFYAIFAAYPFGFGRQFAGLTGPWAVAALAGVLHFPLVYRTIQRAWPNEIMGLVPALFAIAPLASLFALLRQRPADEPPDEPARLNQLAWFGGVALFFITLIFPIQFERQWLTLGWALEGTALLWLFLRVPHPALRATGVVLLAAAFARLAVNPAVLAYQERQAIAVFNWYLYSYGLVTACLFAGARLLAAPRSRTLGVNAAALLATLGTVLAFLLVNIEIADFYSQPGTRVLTFEFSGSFARDMTYTIAWALFALGLLLASIWRKLRAGRYAALVLLGVALLKLFLHDLARLQALYRIGALFAVAMVAIAASLAYQRWLPSEEKKNPVQS